MAAEQKKPKKRSIKNESKGSTEKKKTKQPSKSKTSLNFEGAVTGADTAPVPQPSAQLEELMAQAEQAKAPAKKPTKVPSEKPARKAAPSKQPISKQAPPRKAPAQKSTPQVPPKKAPAKPAPPQNKKTKAADDRPRKRRWPKVLVVILLVLIVGCVGLFSWDRWLRFDDAADFQGQWIYENAGSTVAVTIDETHIAFTDDVEYEYQLNTQDKTVSLSFGTLGSENIYRFSPDRKTLYIAEDATDDWLNSAKVLFEVATVDEGFDPEKTTILKKQ